MNEGKAVAVNSACSLSRRERGGVRGYNLSINPTPLTPTLSPAGRGSPAVPWLESVRTREAARAFFVSLFIIITLALPSHAADATDAEAESNMEVGRYHIGRHDYASALARFRTVTSYRSSPSVAEALARLTKLYLALSIPSEAQRAAAVLAREFPNSPWSAEAANAVTSAGLAPLENP
jgi:hypothetical protein